MSIKRDAAGRFSSTPDAYIGVRYGRLVVKSRAKRRGSGRQCYYECSCDCGRVLLIARRALRSGTSTSCGCYRREVLALRAASRRRDASGRFEAVSAVACVAILAR
jgi:hypothetical protein